jgi:hypothetical protein
MDNLPTADLIDVADLFLTSASILVGALGIARTEGLKTGISLLGIVSTWIWISAYGAKVWWASLMTGNAMALLPAAFILAWFISLFIHGPKFLGGGDRKRDAKAVDQVLIRLEQIDKVIDELSEDEKRDVLRAYVTLRASSG